MRQWFLSGSIVTLFVVGLLLLIISPVFVGGVHALTSGQCLANDGTTILDGNGTISAAGFAGAAGNPLVDQFVACSNIDTGAMGFKIPSLADLLTFAIRAFFVIAGLAALFYLLLGAFAWISSGGDKDSITAARDKIQAAVLGMILIVAVLAIIWTLEQVIFNRRICLGLSCPLTLPGLIVRTPDGDYCCVCTDTTNTRHTLINTTGYKCMPDGSGAPR